ncbi:MAG: FAD-dependent oxidoreductase [Spirosomataceae bacterium]
MKNPRTLFLSSLRDMYRIALKASNQPDVPIEEWITKAQEEAQSRRSFLQKSAQIGIIATGSSVIFPTIKALSQNRMPKIAIVGAGIGGLACGYHLKKAGIPYTIYEASRRTNGRMLSMKGALAGGTWTEFGGEFIDTDHTEMHQLATELNLLKLDVDAPSERALTKDLFFFEGKHYTVKQVIQAFQPFAERIKKDQDSLSDEIDYLHPNNKEFDLLSIDAYLEKIGMTGWLTKLFQVAFAGEYGLDTDQQSSLNFLELFSPDTGKKHNKFELFGKSDERYKIIGGNDQIPSQLAELQKDNLVFDSKLSEVIEPKTGGYVLKFDGKPEVKADIVVLAIPFTTLREVQLKRIKLPEWKRRSIAYMGYGTNSKLMLGFQRRRWREHGYLGFMYHPEVHTGWDNSQFQNNNQGECGYSIFMGGKAGKELSLTEAPKYLDIIESAFPGTKQLHNNKQRIMNWAQNPFSKGSYSCYTTGQWTSIGFAEGIPVGNLYFAGEHCSIEFQGFMNGAAQTGRQVAEEIAKKIKVG